jgi:hypothetical protein
MLDSEKTGSNTSQMTWRSWKKRWESETRREVLLGLLHCGLDIPLEMRDRESGIDEWNERISFYCDVADGHLLDADTEGTPKDPKNRQLAKKAFTVLVNKFLVDRSKHHEDPSWARDFAFPGILTKIVWFFRPEEPYKEGSGKLYNLARRWNTKDHAIDTASAFVASLLDLSFKKDWTLDKEELAILRPRLIRIAACFGVDGLKVLFKSSALGLTNAAPPIRSLSDECVEELRKIALEQHQWLPVVNDSRVFTDTLRAPNTIEEAIWGGSFAAVALKAAELARFESKRFRVAAAYDELSTDSKFDLDASFGNRRFVSHLTASSILSLRYFISVFGRLASDANDRDAAGEFGDALFQLFFVEFRIGILELFSELRDASSMSPFLPLPPTITVESLVATTAEPCRAC